MTVIVVGAGLAGLSAARVLVEAGQEVVVLEARHRVGGRAEGGTIAGHPVELGGTWLGEGHSRMHSLVQELGLETFRTLNDEGQLLVDLAGRRTRMKPHKGAVPEAVPFALADLAQGLRRFERMARRIDLERPWRGPRRRVVDGQTFETWIRPQPAHAGRPGLLPRRVRGGVGAPRPATSHSCTRSSTPGPTPTSRPCSRSTAGRSRTGWSVVPCSWRRRSPPTWGTGCVLGQPVRGVAAGPTTG